MSADNPIYLLLHSRKFLLALADAIASIVSLLATRFLSPGDVDLVKQMIFALQPVVLAVIASIAWEDGKRIENPAITQTVATGIAPNVVTTKSTGDAAPLIPTNVTAPH